MSNVTLMEKFRLRLHGRKNGNRPLWSSEDIDRIAKRYGIIQRDISSAPVLPSRKDAALGSTAVSADSSYDYTGMITTQRKDRSDDTIAPAGLDTSEFRKKPVVFFNHASGELPVGRCPAVWRVNNGWKAAIKLAPASANPLAEQVRQMIDGGFISGISIGFIPRKWEFSNDPSRPYGIDFKEAELIEFSICGIPCNPDCSIDATPVAIGAGKAATNVVSSERVERMRREIARLRGARP